MAQDGDTITYTFSDGTVVSEDISGVGEAVVDYCDGPGGKTNNTSGGSGGRVENATIDVSGHDTLYIWVGGCINQNTTGYGRYPDNVLDLNGTSEISFSNTSGEDSDDEPFLVGAGGGGSGGGGSNGAGGNAGARGGDGGAGDGLGSGGLGSPSIPPPAGGDGADANTSQVGGDGDGAIDDQNRGLVSGGTTILGGGAGPDTDGEIQITYKGSPNVDKNRGRRARLFR
jgi:hypothetical protein